MEAYFVGVKPGSTGGHYCHVPGLWRPARDATKSPWPNYLGPLGEGAMDECWSKRDSQVEGEPRFAHSSGWALVTMWDRSGDSRLNSCAVFAVRSKCTDGEALGHVKRLFPKVFERIEARLGKPVVMP